MSLQSVAEFWPLLCKHLYNSLAVVVLDDGWIIAKCVHCLEQLSCVYSSDNNRPFKLPSVRSLLKTDPAWLRIKSPNWNQSKLAQPLNTSHYRLLHIQILNPQSTYNWKTILWNIMFSEI